MNKSEEELKIEEDKLVKELYKDKSNPFRELVKNLRQQVGALRGANTRLKKTNELVKYEKSQLFLENKRINNELSKLKDVQARFGKAINELARTKEEKQLLRNLLEEQADKIDDLKDAYDNFQAGSGNVLTLNQRIGVLKSAVKELIDPTPVIEAKVVDPYEDKPWMKTDPASTNKALLGD